MLHPQSLLFDLIPPENMSATFPVARILHPVINAARKMFYFRLKILLKNFKRENCLGGIRSRIIPEVFGVYVFPGKFFHPSRVYCETVPSSRALPDAAGVLHCKPDTIAKNPRNPHP